MRTHNIATMAAVLIAAAGTAIAADVAESEPAPVVSNQPATVEFTPMTRSERLRNYLSGTFGPASIARAAATAGFGQLNDSPKEWGQGGQGYADRLGNAYAKHIIRRTLEYGAASALHEDDRYLPSGEKGFWNRTKYAVSSTFLARRENGQRTFAFARMGGAAGAAFISRAWQPASVSGPQNAASSFGFSLATDIGGNMIREFFPDLKRHFRRN